MVVKKIVDINKIKYGEPYLAVTLANQLKTFKFVKQSHEYEDRLMLILYNIEQFDSQDIEKEDILEMHQVVGLFRKIS